MVIRRDGYLQQLTQRRHNPYVKIVTGVRRCGKSYLIKNLYRDELRCRGCAVDAGMLESRERNDEGRQVYRQREVDFVARLGSREYYVQVMDGMPSGRHGENEYESLKRVPGSFRKLAVVNSPFKAYVNADGILVISLEDFLLNRGSLDL